MLGKIFLGLSIIAAFVVLHAIYPQSAKEILVLGTAIFVIYLVIAFVVTKIRGEDAEYYY